MVPSARVVEGTSFSLPSHRKESVSAFSKKLFRLLQDAFQPSARNRPVLRKKLPRKSIQRYFAMYPRINRQVSSITLPSILASFSAWFYWLPFLFVNGFGWQRCESHTESVVTCLGIVLLWLTLQPLWGGGACCPGLSGYVLFWCFCLVSGRVGLVVRSLKRIPCAIVRLFTERQKLSPVFLYWDKSSYLCPKDGFTSYII